VKRYSYRERDYAFGQVMLTLRTSIGLTQAGLADLLGVSRRAVAEWEAGRSYPKAEHLKQVIALGVQQQAFPSGREVEEIRALWRAAHQKVWLDESWLAALLDKQHPPLELVRPLAVEQTGGTDQIIAPPAFRPRVDWGDALAVSALHGRKPELAAFCQWVVQERCCVVSVLGMGGIGKSALAIRLMQQVATHFQVVIFRSLRDAPPAKRCWRSASRCSPRSRWIWCLPASNDVSACCWSTCVALVSCWRKVMSGAICVRA